MKISALSLFNQVSFGNREVNSHNNSNYSLNLQNQNEIYSLEAANAAIAFSGVKRNAVKYDERTIILVGNEKNATPKEIAEINEINEKAFLISEKGYEISENCNDILDKNISIHCDAEYILDSKSNNANLNKIANTKSMFHSGVWTFKDGMGEFVGKSILDFENNGAEMKDVRIKFLPKTKEIKSIEYDENGKTNVLNYENNRLKSYLTNKRVLENGTKQYDEAYTFIGNGKLISHAENVKISNNKKSIAELLIFNSDERAQKALIGVSINTKTNTTKCAEYVELQDYGEPTLYCKNATIKSNKEIKADLKYDFGLRPIGEIEVATKTTKIKN